MEKVLSLNPDIKSLLEDTLLNDGLLQDDIDSILKEKYISLNNETEITNIMLSIFNNKDFSDVITAIANGYSIGEMISVLLIKKDKVDEFERIISSYDLTIDEVRALNKFTTDSNMILSRKRGISKNAIYKSILKKYDDKIGEFPIDNELIKKMRSYIINLDYNIPLYKNYDKTIKFLNENHVEKEYIPSFLTIVKNFDSYYSIDKTLNDLTKALTKGIDTSIVLYRGINKNSINNLIGSEKNIEDLVGEKLSGNYYTSTSLLYDDLLSTNKDYDIIFEIYVPYKTEGIYLKPFSLKRKKVEEIILNENDLYVLNLDKDYIDYNGNNKILVSSLLLSKNKKCYENYDNRTVEETYEDVRNEINSILETIMPDEKISSEFTFYGKENDRNCSYLLKTVDKENNTKIIINKSFKYNSEFEKEMLEPSIIDFSRRIDVNKSIITPLTNEKSNINLIGFNGANMSINNIDNSFAYQVKNIAPNIHADIYSEKQREIINLKSNGNPLKNISARSYAGFTSILLAALFLVLVGLIIIMFLMAIR